MGRKVTRAASLQRRVVCMSASRMGILRGWVVNWRGGNGLNLVGRSVAGRIKGIP
jgi:hypothetical protein